MTRSLPVQNNYDLKILLDDVNIFDVDSGVLFDKAEITESICYPIPQCKLIIVIPIQMFNDNTLKVGTKITFSITSESLNINESTTFTLFNIEEITVVNFFVKLKITGILDILTIFSDANVLNGYGNTSDIFENSAKTLDLTPNIDTTTDTQLWLGGQGNIYQFLNRISKYGYIDNTSGMFWAIDRKKNLLYKNITGLLSSDPENVWNFIQLAMPNQSKKQYVYDNGWSKIRGGKENFKNWGYGKTNDHFNLLNYVDEKTTMNTLYVQDKTTLELSESDEMSLDVKHDVLDVGNFYENYFNAEIQNRRVLSTYSTYHTFSCQYLQNFSLGEVVNIKALESKYLNSNALKISGLSMISAIKINIIPSSITAQVELCMQGTTKT